MTLPRVIAVALGFLLAASLAYATPEYAQRTGRDCASCHLSADGGSLSFTGAAYASLLSGGFAGRVARFIVYYVHFVFAVMWFGTILYVHLILKPGYAAKGLPPGELLLGWLSIVVMAVTGTSLILFRPEPLDQLFSSRFGVILAAKIVIFALMVSTAAFVTTVLGPRMRRRIKSRTAASGGIESFDGKEGRKAYVVVAGVTRDVTESRLWTNGIHMGRHQAGADLTAALEQAPHGADVLVRFPEVASPPPQESGKPEGFVKVFYFLAYTNLVFVLIIIFLITLWKW